MQEGVRMVKPNIYTVKDGDNLTSIAKEHGLTLPQLLFINPALNKKTALKRGQEITIPSSDLTHTIKPKETLTSITGKYGVTLEALAAANPGMDVDKTIYEGQTINIPVEYYVHKVKAGETLSQIARENAIGRISPNTVQIANPQLPENGALKVGQEIIVPTGYYTHKVRNGQNLITIAENYNLGREDINDANPKVVGNNTIQIGQLIRIPSPSVQLAFATAATLPIEKDAEDKPEVEEKSVAKKGVVKKEEASKSVAKKGKLPAAYNISDKSAVKEAWQDAALGKVHKAVTPDKNAKPLIVIDLGHGARYKKNGVVDPGNVSKDKTLTEVEIIDAVGGSLLKQLANAGYSVAVTRNPGEVFLYTGKQNSSLQTRARYAVNLERELKAPYTVMVSLHVNSAAGSGGKGFEVILPKEGYDKVLNKNSEDLGNLINVKMKAKHPSISRGVIDSRGLAIMKEFAGSNAGSDAAVLVELDFLNNQAGQDRLERIRDKPMAIASSIFQAIKEYVHQESPGLVITPPKAPKL
jgi:LysM repeat protein